MLRPDESARDDRLTPRELEILGLLATGQPTARISTQLGIAPSTVKTHLTNIYRKLGTRNRVQAARYYLSHHHD
jgi:DNA-binding CsgD family transcriptional regulator